MIKVRIERVVLWFCLASISLPSYGLSIILDSIRNEYTLTEGIGLSLSFHNDGSESIFLARPRSYGSDINALRIVAERLGCEYEVASAHFDTRVRDLKFFFVPLLQEDTLTHPLPTVADASSVGGLDLLLPGPGDYSFHVEYISVGDSYEAFLGPVWRGTVKSNAIKLQLSAPSQTEVREWRSKLRDCFASRTCMASSATAYFSHVKDEEAARLLIKVLRSEPSDTYAAEALFRQATAQAAEVLNDVGRIASLDMEIRKHYLSLAERLEGAAARDCPEVLSDHW